MNGTVRLRTFLAPFLAGVFVTLGILLATYARAAADTGVDVPDVPGGIVAWWQDGRLAGPVAVAVYVLAWGLGALGRTRVPWLSFLRWGRVRSLLALTTASVFVLLPSAASGSLTWGGLIGAAVAGTMVLPSGGHETPPVKTEDVPS